jgi:hypothetical protein
MGLFFFYLLGRTQALPEPAAAWYSSSFVYRFSPGWAKNDTQWYFSSFILFFSPC